MISKNARLAIQNWCLGLQDGDVIKVIDGKVYLYNSCGCEIDNAE